MAIIENSAHPSFRITMLARHFISNAQIACDLEKFEMVNQLLQMAETLMLESIRDHSVF